MHPAIQQKLPELQKILRAHRVTKAYLFGSAVKGNLTNESDVDVLVNFEENIDPISYSDNFFELLFALQALFQRNVDLVNEKSLRNPYLISSINKTKQLVL
ncbi:hypothetical protein BH09BAC1_BH09BAC1_13470 [soil metagenome]